MSAGDIVKGLAELGTATVYEASGRQGLIDIPLIPLLPGRRVAGPALTVGCGQDDNLAIHACIERIAPGAVVVIGMPEPRPIGLIGELLVTQMQYRGAAAVLIDAAVRDWQELQGLGLPIWTRFVRVRGSSKKGPVRLEGELRMGGATIANGDVIVLDDDGAVVVPATKAGSVLQASRERTDREAKMRTRLAAGEMSYDIHGLRENVERS